MTQLVPVLVPIGVIVLVIVWLTVGVPRLQRRRIGVGPAGPVPGPRVAQLETVLPVAMETAHQLTLDAMSQIRASVVADEPHRICATRSISLLSLGEVITTWLWIDGGGTHVLVESRSIAPINPAAPSRNRTNAEAVIGHLSVTSATAA